ncbi:MAG: hypothetical protein QF830_07885 [Rhodospirillales bacterium]|jgi:hypothetical protein|nr:hypothetical protein [Rhodospirillales bacterium]MDP6884041.1 hypothetical protein [Rhodospirillales bacterium]
MDKRVTDGPDYFQSAREHESRRDAPPEDLKNSETKPWMIIYAITLGILCIPAVVLPMLTGVVALFS